MQSGSISRTKRMVGMAIFTAIIVILQIVGSFVKIGPFSVSLVLVPIVVGAALYGPSAGAVFGLAFGVVVLISSITGVDPGAYMLWAANPPLTAALCLLKGALAGYAAGLVYSAIAKKHLYVGVVCAAVICPVVNTGIFMIAMFAFFRGILVSWAGGSPIVYYAFVGMVGVNFLFELGANIVLSPAIIRIIRA
ncbi:MAG: ECF transporter S component, partial [Firmicutes bacterium]|nr:ECF transporter S component [Bacillota bacterium]